MDCKFTTYKHKELNNILKPIPKTYMNYVENNY